MAEYLEAEHVLALASGTAAMHLALVALGIGPGDEVITTPITWPATANVIVHTGATPVFVDVREDDLNIDPEPSRPRSPSGRRRSCPSTWPASPATSTRSGRSACRWSRTRRTQPRAPTAAASSAPSRTATCFSLYATKNIAAGEGGLVATNDDDVAEAIRDLRLTRRGDGSLYDLAVPGYKANLSDVLAAIALVQLDKLERTRSAARRQFELYDEGLAELDGIEPLARDARDTHALHLYVVRVDPERFGADPRRATARARRGGDRDHDPLPARSPADLVPRALPRPAAAAGGGAGRRRGPLAAALAGAHRRRHRATWSRPRALHDGDAGVHAITSAALSRRSTRVVATVALTALAVAYLVWKIDLGQTAEVLADADPWWFAARRRDHDRTVADGAALAVAAARRRACASGSRG